MKIPEYVCDRCAKCCYIKVYNPDTNELIRKEPCKFLDTNTNLCKVYKDRFKRCKFCEQVDVDFVLDVLNTPNQDVLPETCACIKWVLENKEMK